MGDTSFIPRKYIYLTGIKNIFLENLFWLTELDKHVYNSNSLDCAFEKSWRYWSRIILKLKIIQEIRNLRTKMYK